MIQLELGIRYLSQLRRTRPNDIGRFESLVNGALLDSAAVLRKESGVLVASFDENVIAFWLDLALSLEGIAAALSLVDKELLGRSCVVRADPGYEPDCQTLCRELSRKENPTGVWCDAKVASALSEYAAFRADDDLYLLESFTFRKLDAQLYRRFWINQALFDSLASLGFSNAAHKRFAVGISGPAAMGKSQTLRAVLGDIASSVRVFRISFRENIQGLSCIADALTEERVSEIGLKDPSREQALRASFGSVRTVRASRLAREIPAAPRTSFAVFLESFVQAWLDCGDESKVPVFVAENVHLADQLSLALLRNVFFSRVAGGCAHLAMTGCGDDAFGSICPEGFHLLPVSGPAAADWSPLIASLRAAAALPPADDELAERCAAEAARRGIPSGYRLAVGWNLNSDGSLKSLHPRLTGDLLEAAYALSLFDELFPPGELAEAFSAVGKPRGALPLAFARLAALGVIDSEDDPHSAIPAFTEFARNVLGDRGQAIRDLARQRLLSSIEAKRIVNSYEAACELVRLGGTCDDNRILDAVVDGVLRGEFLAVESALADGSFETVVGRNNAAALAGIFKTRKALVFGDETETRSVFASPLSDSFPNPRYRAYALLDRSAFAFSSNFLDPSSAAIAAASAKEALLLLQANPFDKGLPRAYRLLGETELSRERISEAVDYFGFASESAERANDQYEALLSAVNGASTQFLLGNLSKAERYAVDAERRAAELYQDRWLVWARFMQARVKFEIGQYQQAAEAFGRLPAEAADAALFKNWQDRALAYCDSSIGQAFCDASVDASFFSLESAFLRGSYDETLRGADVFLESADPVCFRNPERVDWSSGFALVEDRAIGRCGGERVVRRLVRVYRAFALTKLGSADEAIADLHRLAKEEPISELDPYDAFYFWTLSVALRESGGTAVDTNTLLGMAFKRLQRRASRIDDAESKRSYLAANRWNSLLYQDAKKINLI